MARAQAPRASIEAGRKPKADIMTTKTVMRVAAGALSVLFTSTAAHALEAGALPQGGTVAGGAASISRSGQTLTVNQASDRAVIDWRSFDIGSGAQANFNQPNAGSIAVNRVGATANPSLIEGGLHANGQVWILNPNGVLFGKTAHVDAAGIVASTANIDPTRFMAGDNRLIFTGSDHGMVANDGSISIADNGLAAFVAPSVRNSGLIKARIGRVTLAAGTTFTLDLAGDRLVEIGLGAGGAVVDQSGKIVDEGGVVTLTARAAGQAVDSVINMSGVVSTTSARQVGGQIVLDGDAVTVAGGLDASGTSGGQIAVSGKTINVAPGATLRADAGADGDGGSITALASVSGGYAGSYSARGGLNGGDGGRIETSGKTVQIADGIFVDTRAPAGVMGGWTIDPDNLTIGASGVGGISGGVNSEDATIAATTVVTALNTSSVNLQANTSITVNAAIDASAQSNGNTLTFKDENADGHLTVNLNAPITLGASQHLAGDADIVNVASGVGIQNGIDVASLAGAMVNVAAGTYAPGATVTKSNLTLNGSAGAVIHVDPGVSNQVNGINIAGGTAGVTVSGFDIIGEITGSYLDYAFTSAISRGVAVANGATGFTIANNTISNVRNGILIDGRNVSGASVTGNTIDNTKGALSIQYTDGSGITITGNSQGPIGNEWGENLHLNGDYDGSALIPAPLGDAPGNVQAALLAAKADNGGWSVQDQAYATSNRTSVVVAASGGSDANQGSARAPLATIQAGLNAVVAGGEVDVNAGIYAPGATIGKSNLTLDGRGVAEIDVNPGNDQVNAINIASNTSGVTVKGFTILGEITGSYVDYVFGAGQSRGIAVANQATGFTITGNTIRNVRTGILVDGRDVTGASITDNLIDNTKSAIFDQYTAGEGITITGNSQGPFGNEWGENFHVNGYYDGSALVPAPLGDASSDVQAALLAAKAANGGWSVQDQAYATSNRTNVSVATTGSDSNQGSPKAQLASIQQAIAAVVSGGEIDVANGTYVIPGGGTSYLLIDKSLSLIGQSEAGTIIDARGATAYGLRVQGDNVTLSNFTLLGSQVEGGYGIKVEPLNLTDPNSRINSFAIDHVTIDGATKNTLDINGADVATIDNVTAENAVAGNGIALIDSANVTITNSTTSNNAWGGLRIEEKNASFNQQTNAITVATSNTFNEASPVYLEDDSSTQDFGGNLNIAGFGYVVKSPSNPADVYTWFQKTQQGAIDLAATKSLSAATVQSYSGAGSTGDNSFTVGVSTGGQALSIQTAQTAAQAGATINVAAGSYAQNVVVATRTNFNFTGATIGSFTLQSAAAGSGLSGSLAATAVTLSGAVTLLGNLELDTSAANGAITTAAIDGATAGDDSLTIKAGGGAVSLGALGGTTRLGATQVSSSATLTGAAYDANSLNFGGNVVLTAASTTFNTTQSPTQAGNITVAGSLLGTTNGGQSAVLTAGRGAGSAGANGDILLQNVGAAALRLGNLTVSGDDFGAQTVDLAGNFAATLVGNQVFSSHTLNAGGTVNSTVGGNASGPINAVGNVSFAVTGDVTGAIAGTNISVAAGTLTGATVNASQGATISAGTVTGSSLNATQNITVSAGAVAGSSFSSTQDVSLNATSVSNSSFNAAQNVSLNADTVASSSFTASQTVNLTATTVGSSTLTAPTVTANAATFDANVAASNGASISGGNISGNFTGGSFALVGTGSVNATVVATSVSVQSPQGTVSGSWQTLSTIGSGQIVTAPTTPVTPVGPVTPTSPTTPTLPATPGDTNLAAGANPSQIVVENFVLPAGTTVTATGEIVLPQGLVIGLLSPGGAGGAPKLIQVQSVQDLGSLLASGYTAIVIDLSGRQKDKKKDDKKDVASASSEARPAS
jgi:filamentous hemagglutinin family protein